MVARDRSRRRLGITLRYNRGNLAFTVAAWGVTALRSKGRGLSENGTGRLKRENFGLSPKDLRTLRALKTPVQIQKFIDALQYQYADTAGSPQRVLRERKGHCLEGALLAAAALRVNGIRRC